MKIKLNFQTRYRRFKAFLLPVQPPALSADLQKNFRHLYFDIGWFGLLNGSAISFLTIFATRLGANTSQIGLINATPAIVALILALPVGSWLENRKIDKSVFYAAIFQRLFYLLMAGLPLLIIKSQAQIGVLILLTLLMSFPGSIIAVGFNVLFAASVPTRYRGMVAGRRNAVFSITTIVTTLICGRILTVVPFPHGYQIIFLIGFFGGVMSAVHLWFVHPVSSPAQAAAHEQDIIAAEKKSLLKSFFANFSKRFHPEALKGTFGKILLFLTVYQFFHYLTIPILPEFQVNELGLSDQIISIGNALFYVTMFIGSTQLGRLTNRFGNHKVTAYGMCIMGLFPITLSFATGPTLFMVSNILAGFAWSLGGTAMINYLLESLPAENSTGSLAWYTLGTNAAVLLGNSVGPIFAGLLGISTALLIYGLLRTFTGLFILRHG